MDVASTVTQILARHADVERPLELDDRLEDLRIDSLGLMEILFELEEAFGIRIEVNANRPDEYRAQWRDLRSAIATVEQLLAQRSAPPSGGN